MLDGLGVAEERRQILDLGAVNDIWPQYLSRLREGGDARERWPSDRRDDAKRRIDELGAAASGRRLVWLGIAHSEPIGIEVPADALLEAALDYLVSPAGDLMITSRDVRDGICIELNSVAAGAEYEIVTWGSFGP